MSRLSMSELPNIKYNYIYYIKEIKGKYEK